MRSLNEYLTESKKQYNYRIKVAGDCPKEMLDGIKQVLARFEMASMSDVRKTPVQKNPYDFPELENESVNIIDVTLDYPAGINQLEELLKPVIEDVNRLVILDQDFLDSVEGDENDRESNKNLLGNPELPPQNTEQKQASAEYAKPGEQRAKEMETRDYDMEGTKPPPAQTTSDLPMGTKSPVGS